VSERKEEDKEEALVCALLFCSFLLTRSVPLQDSDSVGSESTSSRGERRRKRRERGRVAENEAQRSAVQCS
jgi:hypothetical protein